MKNRNPKKRKQNRNPPARIGSGTAEASTEKSVQRVATEEKSLQKINARTDLSGCGRIGIRTFPSKRPMPCPWSFPGRHIECRGGIWWVYG
jgi:hypothetical protein